MIFDKIQTKIIKIHYFRDTFLIEAQLRKKKEAALGDCTHAAWTIVYYSYVGHKNTYSALIKAFAL